MPKIIRDIAILIAFCCAFLLLIFLVRGESTKATTSSNFSEDRLEGDQALKEEDWKQAIVHFARLVEKDKYNGLAQMNLSKAKISKLYEEGIAFTEKVKAGDYSDDEKENIGSKLRAQAVDCIETQNQLRRFPKYQSASYCNLAALNCFIGEDDEAMKFIKKFVRSSSYRGGDVRFDPRFSSLWEREDFKNLFKAVPDFQRYDQDSRSRRRPQ